jgi:hypothetical protein
VREHADPDPQRYRRDGAGDDESSVVAELAARPLGKRSEERRDGAGGGEARRKPDLEAKAGGHRGQGGMNRRCGIDQRLELGTDVRRHPGQDPLDGLVEAFGDGSGRQV